MARKPTSRKQPAPESAPIETINEAENEDEEADDGNEDENDEENEEETDMDMNVAEPATPTKRAGRQSKLSDDKREAALAAVQAGNSVNSVAADFGVSPSAIRYIVAKSIVQRVNQPKAQPQPQPQQQDSELKKQILVVGAALILGQHVDQTELAELKQKIEAEIAERTKRIILTL